MTDIRFLEKNRKRSFTSRGNALVIRQRQTGRKKSGREIRSNGLKEYYSEFDIVKEDEELVFFRWTGRKSGI